MSLDPIVTELIQVANKHLDTGEAELKRAQRRLTRVLWFTGVFAPVLGASKAHAVGTFVGKLVLEAALSAIAVVGVAVVATHVAEQAGVGADVTHVPSPSISVSSEQSVVLPNAIEREGLNETSEQKTMRTEHTPTQRRREVSQPSVDARGGGEAPPPQLAYPSASVHVESRTEATWSADAAEGALPRTNAAKRGLLRSEGLAASPPAPPAPSSTLSVESSLVSQAYDALSTGTHARVYELAHEYRRVAPNGQLKSEVEAIVAIASCRDDVSARREILARYLREWPYAPSTASVRSHCSTKSSGK